MTQEYKKNIIIKELFDLFHKDYSNTLFTSKLYDLFGKNDDAIAAYIKPDREFWHYDGEKHCYRKLIVTYVRTGVMFFIFEDEPEAEHAWFIGSMNCFCLHAAQIYPNEIAKILSEYCGYESAIEDFPKMCETCRWDDCNGNIKIDVIWN